MRKSASRRLASITRLRGIVRASLDDLDRRLCDLLAVRSDETFSFRRIVDHLDGELVAVQDRLAGAEDAYDHAQLQPPKLRERRDELAEELYNRYDSTRRLLAGAFARRYGTAVVEPAPRAAEPLIRHVRLTSSLLHCLRPDSAVLAGVKIDPAALAGELDPRAEELEAVCEALLTARADVGTRLQGADDALAEADRVVSWVARSLEGFYRLGGLDALADRIRAAARR